MFVDTYLPQVTVNCWELFDNVSSLETRQDAMAMNDRSKTPSEIRESASTGIVI